MANIIQLKRGTGAASSSVEPATGEPVFDTGTGKLYISTDGSTALSAMTAINAGTASSLAADNLTAGDAAVTISTSSGNITLDAAANNSDIIFKGTDGGADTTFLTIDGSEAGAATFNDKITAVGTSVFTNLDISGDVDVDGTLEADAITVNGTALAASATTNTVNADNIASGTLGAARMAAAQTAITSLLATDIKIGEDDQTKIDFETADEIHFYAANAEQVYVADGVLGPQTDSDVDLGTTGVRFKDAFVDSITVTGEVDGASLDISGNADIDGTLETDALTIGGTNLLSGNVTFSSGPTFSGTPTVSGTLSVAESIVHTGDTNCRIAFDTDTIKLETGGTARITATDSTTTVQNNLTVTGDLNVDGTTTTVDSTTVAIADAMLKLAKDQANNADALDFGVYGQYGVGGTHKYAGIFRDVSASGDPFTFFDSLQAEPGTTVNTGGTGYDLADISAGGITAADGFTGDITGDVTGNADTATTLATARAINGVNFDGSAAITITAAGSTLSDTVTVAKGGTGATSLTDGGILLGSGTGAVTAMAVLGDGEMIVGDGTTDPVAESGATLRTSIGCGPTAGNTSLVTLGTITTGTWNGSVIASAYLDSDTAHLTTTQTFSGAKTFTANATFGADDTGVDVIFYGATSGKRMTWDESADNLVFTGGASVDGLTLDGGSF